MSLLPAVCLGAALVAVPVLAAPAGAQSAPPSAACQSVGGALRYAGCSLAEQLGLPARGASVVVTSLKSDRELPSTEQLRQRVQGALATALAVDSGAQVKPKLRVELSIEKVGGKLRLNADLTHATGLWQRVGQRKPRAERHAFVEVEFDDELRALIPPPPLVVGQVIKVKAPERGIVALACGPLGSEGGQELAVVTRTYVRVGRIVRGVFAERRRAAWSSLSPVAPAPLREPIASAEITAAGALRVRLSDRRYGLELGADLDVRSRFDSAFPAPPEVDALSTWRSREVGRSAKTAQLVAFGQPARLPPLHVGAELGLGDADGDGNLELAYSADTQVPSEDRLTFVTLEGIKSRARFELPAAAIGAVAICNGREGPGMAPVVVATGDELWLIR